MATRPGRLRRRAAQVGVGLVALAGVNVVVPVTARACSFAMPPAHVIDPAIKATDATPPTLAAMPAVTVTRGQGPSGCLGGGKVNTSCDDLGTIAIRPTATDDQARSEQIGYRLRVVSGRAPVTIPETDVRVAFPDALIFVWIDGDTNEQESFSFTLEISAVDTAGNLSTPVTVVVSDPGSGGCNVAGRRVGKGLGRFASALEPLLLSTITAVAIRRKRRRS